MARKIPDIPGRLNARKLAELLGVDSAEIKKLARHDLCSKPVHGMYRSETVIRAVSEAQRYGGVEKAAFAVRVAKAIAAMR